MTADRPVTGSGATPSGQETCGCGAGGNEPSSDHSSWCPLTREHGSADDIAATINRALRIVTAAGYQDSKGEWHPPAPAQEAGSGRQAAVEAVALPRFSNLLVPVEGHVLVCQGCGSLVLDNPNAPAMHARFHVDALSQRGEPT